MSMPETVLQLAIHYKGAKADTLIPGQTDHKTVVATLRSDLDSLRIPHPKEDNTSLSTNGVIEFWWKTWDHSVRPTMHYNIPSPA
jgi:hypothetical protein